LFSVIDSILNSFNFLENLVFISWQGIFFGVKSITNTINLI